MIPSLTKTNLILSYEVLYFFTKILELSMYLPCYPEV